MNEEQDYNVCLACKHVKNVEAEELICNLSTLKVDKNDKCRKFELYVPEEDLKIEIIEEEQKSKTSSLRIIVLLFVIAGAIFNYVMRQDTKEQKKEQYDMFYTLACYDKLNLKDVIIAEDTINLKKVSYYFSTNTNGCVEKRFRDEVQSSIYLAPPYDLVNEDTVFIENTLYVNANDTSIYKIYAINVKTLNSRQLIILDEYKCTEKEKFYELKNSSVTN